MAVGVKAGFCFSELHIEGEPDFVDKIEQLCVRREDDMVEAVPVNAGQDFGGAGEPADFPFFFEDSDLVAFFVKVKGRRQTHHPTADYAYVHKNLTIGFRR